MASTDPNLEKPLSLLGGVGVLALHMPSTDVIGGVALLLDSVATLPLLIFWIIAQSTGMDVLRLPGDWRPRLSEMAKPVLDGRRGSLVAVVISLSPPPCLAELGALVQPLRLEIHALTWPCCWGR